MIAEMTYNFKGIDVDDMIYGNGDTIVSER